MLSVKALGRRTGAAGAVTGVSGDCPDETGKTDEADEADEGLRTKLGASGSLKDCGVSARLVACAFATGLAGAAVTGVTCKTSPWRAGLGSTSVTSPCGRATGDAVDPAPDAVGDEARLESVR